MADFETAFKKFKGIEFSNDMDVLHKNAGESGFTFYGIYETAHPTWRGWKAIRDIIRRNSSSMSVASAIASQNTELLSLVKSFYYNKFWYTIRLDEVVSQKMAEEMFFFYINVGNPVKVVKLAQSIVAVKADGKIGFNTLKALNSFDEAIFDKEYDRSEISHYKRIVANSPKRFTRFLKGWINRANII